MFCSHNNEQKQRNEYETGRSFPEKPNYLSAMKYMKSLYTTKIENEQKCCQDSRKSKERYVGGPGSEKNKWTSLSSRQRCFESL